MDFTAIGDTTVDEFIKLKEAHIHCDINHEDCTISMKWGDKIPFDSSTLVPGVGNAANAAVAAARLGLSSGFVSNVGKDRFGEEILAMFAREGVDTTYIAVNKNISTNHHYVLWYEAERTILIRHEAYPYRIPEHLEAPKWIYLSSLGENAEAFHHEFANWLTAHPETKLAFQPGTFQIKMGKEKLAALYAAAEVVACNKEEAETILEIGETDIRELLEKMRALGPKIALITDGTRMVHTSSTVLLHSRCLCIRTRSHPLTALAPAMLCHRPLLSRLRSANHFLKRSSGDRLIQWRSYKKSARKKVFSRATHSKNSSLTHRQTTASSRSSLFIFQYRLLECGIARLIIGDGQCDNIRRPNVDDKQCCTPPMMVMHNMAK